MLTSAASTTCPSARTDSPSASNTLAIVEFDADGESVRALGQVVDAADVSIGDEVRPRYVEQLREPGVGLKPADGDQEWDGYRFEPVG
jgi:uncharacterized OB-fold protein